MILFLWSNFKNSYIDKVKKINPIILESGHIDNDLNVGDRKIEIESKNKTFLSVFLNFIFKHLKNKKINMRLILRWINLIIS